MTLSVQFSADLRQWLLAHLERGTAPAALVQEMVAHRMELRAAQAIVDAFVLARKTGRPAPADSVPLPDPQTDYRPGPWRLPGDAVLDLGDRYVPVLSRLERPRVAVLENVFSAEECEQLIAAARGRLQPSTITDPKSGHNVVREHRSSEGMFFRLQESALLARLDARAAAVSSLPVENGEGFQILHYRPGAQNTPHFDFLLPAHAANQASLARSGQRVSTLIVYLNDVEGGGETTFPEVGLSVRPRRGNAVYFEYCDTLGGLDALSLHAGAPVSAGEKWIATKWMRERRFVSASETGAEGVSYSH